MKCPSDDENVFLLLTDCASQDFLLEAIANAAKVAVISVGYRLAPEHPFPQGPEDCFDAAEWLIEHSESKFGATFQFLGGEVVFDFIVRNEASWLTNM